MAEFEGKQGRWITTKTGKHVFIEDGKTVEEALGEAFEDYTYDDESSDTDDTEDFDPDMDFDLEPKYNELIVDATANDYRKLFNDSYCKWHYRNKETDERLSAAKVIKDRFEEAMRYRDIYNEELEKAIILKGKNCMWVIKDYGVSKFQGYTAFLNNKYFEGGKLQISVEYSNKYQIRGTFFHESGHMLDYDPKSRKEYSSSYLSKKYNKTLHNMIYEELSNVPNTEFSKQNTIFDSKLSESEKEFGKGNINYDNQYFRLWKYKSSVADMCQAVKGEKTCKEIFNGYLGHSSGYFHESKWSESTQRGAELFAELTESILMDGEHLFLNFIREYAPKSLEIYQEILKEKIYGK